MVMSKNGNGKLTVYDPTADEVEGQDELATRFNTLDGKVVGLLNNTKDRSDIVLDQLEQQLRAQFPGSDIRHYRKQSVSGMTPDIKGRLIDEVDVLITAAAD